MQIIRETVALRSAIAALRESGGSIALVPTMGALHAGHMALVAEAKLRARHVVASIFVNPRQFGANEDLSTYPRREAGDARMLEEAGAAILWAPPPEEMYPDGYATTISVSGVSEGLCGATRPGHAGSPGHGREYPHAFANTRRYAGRLYRFGVVHGNFRRKTVQFPAGYSSYGDVL